jgi:hypothetical protein
MIIDLAFFGMPLVVAVCLAGLAVRHADSRYWPPAFSIFAYCAFYLAGGRDVVFYLGSRFLQCAFLL